MILIHGSVVFGPYAKKAVLSDGETWMRENETMFMATGWGQTSVLYFSHPLKRIFKRLVISSNILSNTCSAKITRNTKFVFSMAGKLHNMVLWRRICDLYRLATVRHTITGGNLVLKCFAYMETGREIPAKVILGEESCGKSKITFLLKMWSTSEMPMYVQYCTFDVRLFC